MYSWSEDIIQPLLSLLEDKCYAVDSALAWGQALLADRKGLNSIKSVQMQGHMHIRSQ